MKCGTLKEIVIREKIYTNIFCAPDRSEEAYILASFSAIYLPFLLFRIRLKTKPENLFGELWWHMKLMERWFCQTQENSWFHRRGTENKSLVSHNSFWDFWLLIPNEKGKSLNQLFHKEYLFNPEKKNYGEKDSMDIHLLTQLNSNVHF